MALTVSSESEGPGIPQDSGSQPPPVRIRSGSAVVLPGLRLASDHGSGSSPLVQRDAFHGLVSSEDQAGAAVDRTVETLYAEAEAQRLQDPAQLLLQEMLDISSVVSDGIGAIVDDSFLRCFTSASPDPWNWNFYLFPAWVLGVVFRYVLLFPLRLALLLSSLALFFVVFGAVQAVLRDGLLKQNVERRLVQLMCSMFVASWTGVIKFHGPVPKPGVNRVWVANHTSMIDYILLCSYFPFAVIMQLHLGWVGFLQTRVLKSLGCLWFNRTESKDRELVQRRMVEHVGSASATPLLIFPEGTCVNNEYCVMFKRGAFDLGATVCPIAIKYNKIFVDAFWNSRRMSFTQHLLQLMTSWAVVCDVYFLEPQSRRQDESATDFATRVQAMIARQAKLRVVPWDGYLKYYNLGEKHPQLIEKRRRVFADMLARHGGIAGKLDAGADSNSAEAQSSAGGAKPAGNKKTQ